MAIRGCGSPAHCCQPAGAGGFIYADLRSELYTPLASQALFTQSSPVQESLLQAFPSKHTGGGDTAPAFSGWHVYLQFIWEVCLPPSLVEFSSSHCHFYKLSRSKVAGQVLLLLPSLASVLIYSSLGKCPYPSPVELFSGQTLLQAFRLQGCWVSATTTAFSVQLVYLKFLEGLPLPPLVLRALHPLCYVSFFFVVVVYSVWFFCVFALGGGQSVQGATLIWPRVVFGSTACCLAHLVVCISRASRSWCLAAREPSWFLHLMWSGDAMLGQGVWRSWGFASSRWLFL
jgi:hypothetical protein